MHSASQNTVSPIIYAHGLCLPWIAIFCCKWGDVLMIFKNNAITSEIIGKSPHVNAATHIFYLLMALTWFETHEKRWQIPHTPSRCHCLQWVSQFLYYDVTQTPLWRNFSTIIFRTILRLWTWSRVFPTVVKLWFITRELLSQIRVDFTVQRVRNS